MHLLQLAISARAASQRINQVLKHFDRGQRPVTRKARSVCIASSGEQIRHEGFVQVKAEPLVTHEANLGGRIHAAKINKEI